LDFGMRHHGSADFSSRSGNKINDSPGNPGFFTNSYQVVGGMRRLGCWLENHRITTNQCGDELPGGNSHGEIPGRNERTNPQWHPNAHGELIRQFGRSRVPTHPSPFTGCEVGHIDGFLNVPSSLVKDLSHFAGHLLCKFLFALDENLPHPEQDLSPPGSWYEPPAYVSFAGRLDGAFNVLSSRFLKDSQNLASVGWIPVFECSAGGRTYPFSADKISE